MSDGKKILTCVCAIAKNENHYIREWVEHYKNIGFDSIYLFDNNDSNGENFSEVIGDFIDNKFVIVDKTYRGKSGKLYQIDAYQLFYSKNKNKYDWILFVDIDEFLTFENCSNIKSFLNNNKFNGYDMIRFCWKCYTDNNLVYVKNNNYSVKRFTEVTDVYSTQCKSMIRGGLNVTKFNCHGVYESWVKSCDALGNPCDNGSVGDACNIGIRKVWNGAWINHYRFKTISEFFEVKKKNWEWLDKAKTLLSLNAFFSVNEITNEKLEYLKSNNIEYSTEKIIISFTTWKKRIHLTTHVFNLMLSQTKLPNKIILNLAVEEFPGKENDLPKDLIKLINNKNHICSINWVNEDTKVWKKFMPILNKYPNDVIIPIDDDIEYPKNYVEVMYSEYIRRGKLQPIVCYPNLRENNIYSHSGPFSLIKKEFFGEYLDEIYNGLISKKKDIHWQSDEVYTYCILLNKRRYYFTNKIDGKKLYDSSSENKKNAYSDYKNGWTNLMNKIKTELNTFILERYHVDKNSILSNKINVNFTTWKGRDKTIDKMLETIKNQTLKPDAVNLFLSKTEYNNIIPENIKKLYENGYITNIIWIEGNIYSYKRWEIMKKYSGWYNIFVDDDILYDLNYVKDLYNTAIKNQGCEIVWSSLEEDYVGVKREYLKYDSTLTKSKKLQTLSGVSCYPPFTFPLESFNHIKDRDMWCKKCDDSWNRAWLIKNNVNIVRIYDRRKKVWKVIDETQDVGIWNTENKLYVNGVENIVKNFANALICANAVEEAKKIWPKFDIYACCSKELLKSLGKENLIKSEPVVTTHKDDIKQVVEHDDAPIYITDSKPVKKQKIIRHADTITKIKKKPPVKKLRTFIQHYDRMY